ncbi:MAG: RodZ domain-containing protein [Pseudomonadota bacterium]
MSANEDIIETDAVDTEMADAVSEPATAGARLKAAREEKRLTLDLVAAETRIPKRHLETIEADEFESLPSRTYAIGFARSYARAVACDEKEIADLVREHLGQSGPRSSAMGQDMEPGDPAKLPSKGLAIFGGIAALIFALGVITFAGTYYGAGEGPASLLASIQADEPTPIEAGTTETNLAKGTEETALSPDGQVVFTALEDGVWVRFYEQGGERLFEAQMESGDTFEVPASATAPLINTGRPDAFAITIDGREVPKLSEEPVTMGDAPISASALLARADG